MWNNDGQIGDRSSAESRCLNREEPAMADRAEASKVGSVHTPRVVIVEDHRDARDMLRWLLEDAGYDVHTAETGPTGLRCIREVRPSVAIVDISLPELDGYAVARAVRADSRLASTLLIALTGHGGEEDRQAAFAAGFQVHLAKPVDLGQLERTIRQLVAADVPPVVQSPNQGPGASRQACAGPPEDL
jgi:CheY-like chemotaxis protein